MKAALFIAAILFVNALTVDLDTQSERRVRLAQEDTCIKTHGKICPNTK